MKDKVWDKPGTVVDRDLNRRTYLVRTPQGNIRRNRIHLQPVAQLPPMPPPPEDFPLDLPPARGPAPQQPIAVQPPLVAMARPSSPATPQAVRKSQRTSVRPKRLIEDI